MLKEAITKQEAELEKRTAEYEDARKRFSQVKEALTVERNLRARAEIKEEQMRQEIIATTGQMTAMRDNFKTRIETQTVTVQQDTSEYTNKIAELEKVKAANDEVVLGHESAITALQGELNGLKQALSGASAKASELAKLAEKAGLVDSLRGDLEKLQRQKISIEGASKEEVTRLRALVKEQEEKLGKADEERRKMYNIIQELRGNIRVYVRVRPFLSSDKGVDLEGKLDPACRVNGVQLEIVKRDDDGKISESHRWDFDKSFPCETTQEEIFAEVNEFVQSALDGYNVCLFSYGQTGTGKTHTMQGYGKGEMRGIIPRAIEAIAANRDAMASKDWTYVVEIACVEIYNECVYDLLRAEDAEKVDLPIKQDAKGKIYVAGVNKTTVDPADQKAIDELMETAALNRAMGATDMNTQSSRSHCIFSVYITGTNADLGATVTGCLHLCDLAGSERIDRSGVDGDGLKEAMSINKSLACLTDCFNGLGQKAAFIPFRNSKLTYFLQNELSGDGKTMMFVNLSPNHEDYFESLCSLRFANGVNKIELGKAIRNVVEASTGTDKESNTGGGGKTPAPSSKAGAAKGAAKKK
jgi:kinesin family protein C1